ncbi:MAG: ATP-binding protein [Halanaerobiaceae bacterium]
MLNYNLPINTSINDMWQYETNILNHIHDFVIVQNKKHEITWANTVAQERFGKSLDELKGKKCFQVIQNKSFPCKDCPVSRTLKSCKAEEGEINSTDNNILYVKSYPLTEDGEMKGVVEIALDITASKKLKAIVEDNKLKSTYFAKLSHELKTPLNLIFSALQIKQKKDSDDRYLNIIKQNSLRLLKLVNNVIDLTKIDANNFEINLDAYDIVNIIKQIVHSTEDYVINNNKSIIMMTNLDKKIIKCDPFSIERIMLNLISNAVKFTDEGEEIIVKIEDNGDSVLISVKDNGIGIKSEELESIFELFKQVDESFTRRAEGSGIGLSLVKSLVNLHNGDIWVNSEYGIGTEVFIELPVENISETFVKSDYTADNLIEKINVEFSDIYNI